MIKSWKGCKWKTGMAGKDTYLILRFGNDKHKPKGLFPYCLLVHNARYP